MNDDLVFEGVLLQYVTGCRLNKTARTLPQLSATSQFDSSTNLL